MFAHYKVGVHVNDIHGRIKPTDICDPLRENRTSSEKVKKHGVKKNKKKIMGEFFFITSTITSNLFLAVPEVLALRTVSFIPSVRFQNNHSGRPF